LTTEERKERDDSDTAKLILTVIFVVACIIIGVMIGLSRM